MGSHDFLRKKAADKRAADQQLIGGQYSQATQIDGAADTDSTGYAAATGAADKNVASPRVNLSRRQFSAISGVSLGALVAVGALARWGVTERALAKRQVSIATTPTKMIVTHRARCSGCQRCELACSLKNSHKSSSELARLKVWRNYQYGAYMGSGEGIFGSFNFTQDFCKQCKRAMCMEHCPMSAIVADPKTGARVVLDERCIGCGTCHEACPWNMPTIDKETGKSTKCIACGRCARHCPNKAIEFIDWQDLADEYLRLEGRPLTETGMR